MRKKDTLCFAFVFLGFALGFVANLLGKHFFPMILPAGSASSAGLLAFLLQLVISVGAVYISGSIIRKNREKRG